MTKTRFLAVLSSFLMLTACGSYSEDSSAVNVQSESLSFRSEVTTAEQQE
ncbi:MAG: hypothetical protein IJ740_15145 [Ruminococcus sp.]|nr:hypothetical protein [Ruminococcus sp.]